MTFACSLLTNESNADQPVHSQPLLAELTNQKAQCSLALRSIWSSSLSDYLSESLSLRRHQLFSDPPIPGIRRRVP